MDGSLEILFEYFLIDLLSIVFLILFLIIHFIGLLIDLQWNKFMHRNERDAYYQNWADYFP